MVVAYSREKEVECEILPLHYLHIPDHELARSFLVATQELPINSHPPSFPPLPLLIQYHCFGTSGGWCGRHYSNTATDSHSPGLL